MSKTHYEVGERVVVAHAFTSPIGCHFAAGSSFTVELGGFTAGRSIRLRSDGPDASVVWISDGWLLVAD